MRYSENELKFQTLIFKNDQNENMVNQMVESIDVQNERWLIYKSKGKTLHNSLFEISNNFTEKETIKDRRIQNDEVIELRKKAVTT